MQLKPAVSVQSTGGALRHYNTGYICATPERRYHGGGRLSRGLGGSGRIRKLSDNLLEGFAFPPNPMGHLMGIRLALSRLPVAALGQAGWVAVRGIGHVATPKTGW